MAKWGEGDPRWIVEEREDAKNVNNWHWSEKNATQWSKDYINKLLINTKIENDNYVFEITSITKLEGEAVANNRKAKVIVFYEWDLEAEWKGQLKNNENKTEFKGKFEVPNLSEEYSASELEVLVSVEKNSTDANKVKDFVRTEGTKIIKEKLGKYINDLKTEYTKDLILPTKKTSIVNTSSTATNSNPYKNSINEIVRSAPAGHSSKNMVFEKLELEEEFFCTPADLYQVLLNSELSSAYSRSLAKINPAIGGEFSMFGDTVSGTFEELINPSSIKMKWRHKSWPIGCMSTVEITLKAIDSGTSLILKQEGIPEKFVSNTKCGWLEHYFNAIKMTFGYGGRLF